MFQASKPNSVKGSNIFFKSFVGVILQDDNYPILISKKKKQEDDQNQQLYWHLGVPEQNPIENLLGEAHH